jgi:hypothetical protein
LAKRHAPLLVVEDAGRAASLAATLGYAAC